MAGALQVDNITNSAGTGAPTFPSGVILSTSQVIQADTITNAAGTGAPNFTHGATLSTSQVLQADTLTNAAGSGAPNFSHGATVTAAQTISVDTINNTTANGGVAIEGVSGSGNASTGYVGEFVLSSITVGVNASSGSLVNVTSITLGAGDWDISASVTFESGSTTNFTSGNSYVLAISTTTASSAGTIAGYSNIVASGLSGTIGNTQTASAPAAPLFRVALSSTTTYFLNANTTFTSTTPVIYGFIAARRRR